jgi:hypothetical protein
VLVTWVGRRPGPWVCRSLERAGHRVWRAHPAGEAGGRRHGVAAPLRYPLPASDPERFLGWLRTVVRDRGIDVVLPLDEDIVRMLADHHPTVEGARVAGPDARQYRMLCDKRVLDDTAAAADVGRPRAVAVGDDGPDGEWPPLPSVVKPRRSTAEAGDLDGASVVRDVAERDEAVAGLLRAGVGAIVEERLEGRQWVVHCVRRRDGEFAGIAAVVNATAPRAAGTPSVLEVVPGAAAVDATRRLFDAAGYVGLGNAQFFERDGEFSVHDVNLRPPASIGLAVHAGFDAPALGIAAVMDDPLPLREPAGPVFRYVSADEEIRALASALRNGGRSTAPSIIRRALVAGVRREEMLDPPLSDIDWVCGRVTVAFKRAARVARKQVARA